MHKLTKGLKKKKKGKKSKHKEDDLFKPEELEAYRKQHQAVASPTKEDQEKPGKGNEDWKKFTAGIDSVLKKTQDDLDRIKSTSFFQRVTVPSAPEKQAKSETSAQSAQSVEEPPKAQELGIVEVSESETEEEDEDIFDTSYLDVIATGEVKLAYIPESPTEQQTGDDPFDTSIAERAILGPAVERRGKKLVPIGSAVEVLTGRVQAPTCVPLKRPSPKRAILQQRDLLLGSFDEGIKEAASTTDTSVSEPKPTLLDTDDAPPDLATTPIDLSKNLLPTPITNLSEKKEETAEISKDEQKKIIEEFANEPSQFEEDGDDIEFELLAAESLSKPVVTAPLPTEINLKEEHWDAFSEDQIAPATQAGILEEISEPLEDDPFDTTFAENILPGKTELKLIEKEILSIKEEQKAPVQIKNTNDILLKVIPPAQRDLLGGSNTDLTKLGEQPLKPQEKVDENYIEYCDPFDTTSIINTITEPCQTELKYLEEELLSDLKHKIQESVDDDFDPRAEEKVSRKESLTDKKAVGFVLPLQGAVNNSLGVKDENKKVAKPLTPYYIRENSIPEKLSPPETSSDDPFDTSFTKRSTLPTNGSSAFVADFESVPISSTQSFDLLTTGEEDTAKALTPATEVPSNNFDNYADPFDTSIANNLAPGNAELKQIEKELVHTTISPTITPSSSLTSNIAQPSNLPNLLEDTVELTPVKPLTPLQIDEINEADFLDEVDPFDTSIADNIHLGKTEIKLLESELL